MFSEKSMKDKPSDVYQEEEEEFDSGTEFDDVRKEDEKWVEPKYQSEDFVSQPTHYNKNAFRLNALQFMYPFIINIFFSFFTFNNTLWVYCQK